MIGCPIQQTNTELPQTQIVSGADTSATGVKLSFAVPAGVTGLLLGGSAFSTAVAGVVSDLQVVRGATTVNVARITTSGTVTLNIPLTAGDTVQWRVSTAQALSTTDYALSVDIDQSSQRVTISTNDPAILDNGINLYPGGPPLTLLWEDVGQALVEPLTAIAASGTVSVTVLDIFG